MPLFPEQVPEHDRELVGLVIETEAFSPRDKCLLGFAHLGHAGEIALDVTCNVTVLPVPVAPVISPWRLANASVKTSGLILFPTKIVPSLSRFAMAPFLPDNSSLLSLSRVCGQPAAAATEASASWRPHEHARSRSLSHCIG